jgi:hypothetical protein
MTLRVNEDLDTENKELAEKISPISNNIHVPELNGCTEINWG